ncbi:MAG: acyl-CoA thioesterase-1 [Lysobacterales bacterium]
MFLLGNFLFCPWAWSVESPVILVVGDSISAGFGMELSQSWPRLLQKRLDDNGQEYRVVNSSISGDTTQGGATRLPRLLTKYQPELVIIELGGNDGLRGIGVPVTKQNLSDMIEKSQAAGAKIILTGIRLPPNYGATYTGNFYAMYGELEAQFDLMLVPFFMEGVAFKPELMQGDGIHPNADGQPVLLDTIWPLLEPVLE